MIYYFTPYIKGNLGQAYNHYCNLVPNDEDWITMVDGDIMQLHMDWGDKWNKILDINHHAGIITCKTNRITCPIQKIDSMFHEHNLREHRNYAIKLFNEYGYSTAKIKCSDNYNESCMSGFFFAFKKSTWKLVNGFCDGILHVDTDFFNKVKQHKECLVANGFYVLHYYRLLEGYNFISHLSII